MYHIYTNIEYRIHYIDMYIIYYMYIIYIYVIYYIYDTLYIYYISQLIYSIHTQQVVEVAVVSAEGGKVTGHNGKTTVLKGIITNI
jgi:hypothetical protein